MFLHMCRRAIRIKLRNTKHVCFGNMPCLTQCMQTCMAVGAEAVQAAGHDVEVRRCVRWGAEGDLREGHEAVANPNAALQRRQAGAGRGESGGVGEPVLVQRGVELCGEAAAGTRVTARLHV